MFTKDQKIWIIENFSPSEGLHQLRRLFISHYKPVNHKNVPLPHHFGRVVSNFKDTGSIQDRRATNGAKPLSEVKINLIKDHFETNPKSSLRGASRDINIPVATIQKTLKKTLKFKPYRATLVQTLTAEHRHRRKQACSNFMQMDPGWQRNIIFSDEKWFSLKPHPNRKNDVYWSPDNPGNIEEVRDQGVSKVMAWVGIVDGRVLPITWFQGSVTGLSYLEMLEKKVWPAVKSVATKKKYWFQQDGARVHTTKDCLAFLKDKFQGRVISNRLDFFWPAKSPDLNPLDFYFWGVAEARVREEKPKTIEELKAVVENFVGEICKETLWNVADNFIKRAKMCHQQDGGHFEHLM